MKNRYVKSFFSSTLSIAPMIVIILLLAMILHLNGGKGLRGIEITMLLIGMVVLIIGLTLFQIGASIGLTKVGEYMGTSLSKQKNLFIVIIFTLTLGALITCAEPSILIVSKQVKINSILMIGSIALGVGIFVVIGILRVFYRKDLKLWYLFFYFLTFMLIVFIAMDKEKSKFLPFIFDSGGITTGSATVPFILALGAGVATVRGGKNAKDDSFGLVGLASVGPILTMTILIMISSKEGGIEGYTKIEDGANIFKAFMNSLLPNGKSNGSMLDVIIALTPIMAIFGIYEAIFIKLPKTKIYKLLFGFFISFIGLSLFLCATSAVMTPIGASFGESLGMFGFDNGSWIIILVAFMIGLVTILCEPAVHVLTTQIRDISEGQISKLTVLLYLSLGVGIAIALAAIRTIYQFSILYYMIPGYIISITLMFFCPNIYTAMAFDSGGTASGPMSSSFVLPMISGIFIAFGDMEDQFENSFGVVALIALTPIIAIQILGCIQNIKAINAEKINRKYVYSIDDAQIIHF